MEINNNNNFLYDGEYLHINGSISKKGDYSISSEDIRKFLKTYPEDKKLKILLNSTGGEVFESIAISNYFKNRGNVEIIILSIAASGASIIAMGCDKIKMFRNSFMLIHKSNTIEIGNSDNFEKTAEDLAKIDKGIIESYRRRFKGSLEELQKVLKEETILTANECLNYGLCDEIIEKDEKTEKIFINKIEKTVKNEKNLLKKFK